MVATIEWFTALDPEVCEIYIVQDGWPKVGYYRVEEEADRERTDVEVEGQLWRVTTMREMMGIGGPK
jgi:hypothetical protein